MIHTVKVSSPVNENLSQNTMLKFMLHKNNLASEIII